MTDKYKIGQCVIAKYSQEPPFLTVITQEAQNTIYTGIDIITGSPTWFGDDDIIKILIPVTIDGKKGYFVECEE